MDVGEESSADRFDGALALVTGGGSGIGRLTAQRLAALGADVVIADVAVDAGEATALEVGGRFVALDVSDPAQWQRLVDGFERDLDIAHLNAGVSTGEGDITKLTDEQYHRIMRINVDGVVFGARAVVPHMNTGGAIVATASLGGLVPMADDPIYSMGKHAVVALVRSLAPQLAERGLTINAVCPGFADTPLVTPDHRTFISQLGVPLLDPAVVADTVLRIVSDRRTGQAWFVQPGREPAPYEFRGVPGPRLA
jgi:NAD(P)-dependent dehydrogenase (short-subunit alcohol dehydrogenase family)